MDVRAAIRDTYALAIRKREYSPHSGELSFNHLSSMVERIQTDPRTMSEAKLNRWLGWMQAAIISWGVASLDDMKEINRRHME